MSFYKVLKIAGKFEGILKKSQSMSMMASDVQVALGMNESSNPTARGLDKDYFDPSKRDAIMNNVLNTFKIDNSTHGKCSINLLPGGKISFTVGMSAENKKEKAMENFLANKCGLDMTRKIALYAKSKNKSLDSQATAVWFTF